MKTRIIVVKSKPKVPDKKAQLIAEKIVNLKVYDGISDNKLLKLQEILKMIDKNKKKFAQVKSKVDTRWRTGTPHRNKSWRCQKRLMSSRKKTIQAVWRKPNES